MSINLLPLTFAAVVTAGITQAEVPIVAVDIAPVHSLVARVMDGVGRPDLIIPPGATPHAYYLRPSEAEALQEADIVFWTSESLTPWLAGTIQTLAANAVAVDLMEVPGTTALEIRQGALFEPDEHGDEGGEEATAEAGHSDDPADHAGSEAGHDDRDEISADGEAHDDDQGAHDPHAWLSPDNAKVWLDAIAAELSTADPENAEVYLANATAGKAELDTLAAEIEAVLEPVRGNPFIVFHDAFQYFETSFGIPASGAISLSDAARPSPARIAAIRDRVSGEGVSCVLAEPQFNPALVQTVLDGTEARSATLDPLGADLAPGAALYPQLMRNLAQSLADCL